MSYLSMELISKVQGIERASKPKELRKLKLPRLVSWFNALWLIKSVDKSNKSISSLSSKHFQKEALAFKLPPLESDSGKGMHTLKN